MNTLLNQVKKIEKGIDKILSLNEQNITYQIIPWEYECLNDKEIDFMCDCEDKSANGECLSTEEADAYKLLKDKVEMYYEEFIKSSN